MAIIWFIVRLTMLFAAVSPVSHASAQIIPAGQFFIGGFPVNCGPLPTILTNQIPDVAMFSGQAILINPGIAGSLPTVLQIFVYAHECGHAVVGADEVTADCWAIRTGKHQGWFPSEAFQSLIAMFQGNPGTIRHPPGPVRVAAMMQCYQAL